jgi:hypothetical protein
MKTERINIRFGIIVLMILAATLSRLIPHPWNFTAIGAMALFGGAYFPSTKGGLGAAFAIPLVSLWLGDFIMNNTIYASLFNHKLWLVPDVFRYVGFILITLLGLGMLKKIKLPNVIGASLLASIIFFLVTNFGAWLGSSLYPQTGYGLIACYTAGIPFFWNTVGGDLFYVSIMFGAVELAKMKFPKLATVQH